MNQESSNDWRTVLFKTNSKTTLPSIEELVSRIAECFPDDFSTHYETNSIGLAKQLGPDCYSGYKTNTDTIPSPEIMVIGEKKYDKKNKKIVFCHVKYRNDRPEDGYEIIIRYGIGKYWNDSTISYGDYLDNIKKFSLIEKLALFTIFIPLLIYIIIVYLYLRSSGRLKILREEGPKLEQYGKSISRFLKTWEKELNTNSSNESHDSSTSSNFKDRIAAMKVKISSANGNKGFKITEDGTIIRL